MGSGGQTPTGSDHVEEIFNIANVHMFHVRSDGIVTTRNTSTTLQVFKLVNFDRRDPLDNRPTAWLEVGEWSYPLVPGKSPLLSCEYGAFFFPDSSSPGKGCAVGVILPSENVATIHDALENLLSELTQVQPEVLPLSAPVPPKVEAPVPPEEKTSYKISKGIIEGCKWFSSGLVKGAEMVAPYVNKGASMLREKIQPEGQPTEIDPRVQQGIAVLQEATGTARRVTGAIVSRLGTLTMAIAKQLAPHVREHGTRLISSALPMSSAQSQSAIDDVMIVAAGGLQGFNTVYVALQQAATILAHALCEETVEVVGHKYGQSASEVLDHALHSVGNLALTAHNVQSLGVSSIKTTIATRTAKEVGKIVLQEYIEKVDKQSTEAVDGTAASGLPIAPSTSASESESVLTTLSAPPSYNRNMEKK